MPAPVPFLVKSKLPHAECLPKLYPSVLPLPSLHHPIILLRVVRLTLANNHVTISCSPYQTLHHCRLPLSTTVARVPVVTPSGCRTDSSRILLVVSMRSVVSLSGSLTSISMKHRNRQICSAIAPQGVFRPGSIDPRVLQLRGALRMTWIKIKMRDIGQPEGKSRRTSVFSPVDTTLILAQ